MAKDPNFLKKFAPWLEPYKGANELEAMDVHAANKMLARLEVEHTGRLPQIRDSIASFLIDGKTIGAPPLLSAFDMGALHTQCRAEAEADLAAKFRKLQTSMANSAETKVREFEAFARESLEFMYAGEKDAAITDRVTRYVAAYDQDHGSPLFSKDAKMRPMVFDGKNTLPDELVAEYKELSRTFGFGVHSKFSRDMRFERHAKQELAKQFPSANPAQIETKFTEKKCGQSIELSFEKNEAARRQFITIAKQAVLDDGTEPDQRLAMLQRLLSRYDNEFGDKESTMHMSVDDKAYAAAKQKAGLASHGQRLAADGSGRQSGARSTAPKSDGNSELG